jgi:uncharacterized membrane protein YphA (DoxX/SURF4 family)
MNLALWIVAIVLAASFAGSGLMKLSVPKDKLVKAGQGWAQDFSPNNIRLIGFIEVLGAAGLILPAVTHIAPILVSGLWCRKFSVAPSATRPPSGITSNWLG